MVVLYRKYRPQSFAEVIGQDHIVKTLINSIKLNSISHAYLFSGPRGSGKTSIARLFAKAINCQQLKGQEPCNKCSSCNEINNGSAIDLVEIDAASYRGIEEMKSLKEGINFSPVKLKYKVFIIDECHQLTSAAVNALLKTLEEPPDHAVFILATTEVHKMIPTILSRCQRFDFRKLDNESIQKKIKYVCKKENIRCEEEAVSLISFLAKGSFRDAESLLDQCVSYVGQDGDIKTSEIKDILGVVEISVVSNFVDLLLEKKSKEAVESIQKMLEGSIDINQFAKMLISYLHYVLNMKMNSSLVNPQNSGLSKEDIKKMEEQVSKVSLQEIKKIIELFIKAENDIKYASVPQLPLELAILDAVGESES